MLSIKRWRTETTDKKDKFYIYKMNCKSVWGKPSYVFKTSTKALEIAQKMEQKETEGQHTNSLSLEWAYMDGMHSRVRGYKTLTLWTYHPGMNKVMALATNLTRMVLCVMRAVQI